MKNFNTPEVEAFLLDILGSQQQRTIAVGKYSFTITKTREGVQPTMNYLCEELVSEVFITTNTQDDLIKEVLIAPQQPSNQVILYKRLVEKMTLEQIAKIFNVTKERVRQVEQRALRTLRYATVHSRTKLIKGLSLPLKETPLLEILAHAFSVPVYRLSDYIQDAKVELEFKESIARQQEEFRKSRAKTVLHSMPIQELGLSVRSYNCLTRAKVHVVSELLALTDSQLMSVRNLGGKSLQEIRAKIAEIVVAQNT